MPCVLCSEGFLEGQDCMRPYILQMPPLEFLASRRQTDIFQTVTVRESVHMKGGNFSARDE